MINEKELREKLAYDETFSCVQCGYCLPACPTYMSFGKETHSPRGRINLVKMAAEGKISIHDMANPIDLCLGCRACETVCPTNVEYGKILTSAVNVLAEYREKDRRRRGKALRNIVFHHTLPNKKVLKLMGQGLYILQKTKMINVVRKSKLLSVLPSSIKRMESITPEVKLPLKRNSTISLEKNPGRLRIGYFPGCVMDTFFANVNDLAIKLLEMGGCEVVTIKEQGCCGALQHHAGERNQAIALAKKNIEAYEKYELDHIVNAIGGCGAALVEYPLYFDESDPWFKRATDFAEKNQDISVILSKLGLSFTKSIKKYVSYQPSCHLTNVQRVTDEPLQVLQSIPGITYVEIEQKDMCCGSAGIYNIVHHEESMLVLDDKMKHVKKIVPEVIVTTNPGCHLQLVLGVKREGLQDKIEVVHLVEIIAESCGIS
ncbi:(Fe-S)-binding protein [Sporosarcina sp. G11-34]|uniref:(Fe-S)-binding protein n=1 Tax=Sporosarcina sp. G11-34 TaxID=2849605 RepID=UPI0022A9E5E3|nr:(Fe-S)-binding protein [Sporosarcina sp. G11-34]MCZ2257382.1 (Fe-S)-binding protein [Sporosarcina sp. G11-34]